MAEVKIGSATLTVVHEGYADNRACYRYTITVDGKEHTAQDLRSGNCSFVSTPTEEEMLRTLCAFLGAAAEAYEYDMRGGTSDNRGMFPEWVEEWSYQNQDELADASEFCNAE